MKLVDAITHAGNFGRVRSDRFSGHAIGIHMHDGKPFLFFHDEGKATLMLSKRAAQAFLSDGGDDWRPAN